MSYFSGLFFYPGLEGIDFRPWGWVPVSTLYIVPLLQRGLKYVRSLPMARLFYSVFYCALWPCFGLVRIVVVCASYSLHMAVTLALPLPGVLLLPDWGHFGAISNVSWHLWVVS